MPSIHHPTLMDIIRYGLAAAAIAVFVWHRQARRDGRELDAQTLWQLDLVLLAILGLAWILPLN